MLMVMMKSSIFALVYWLPQETMHLLIAVRSECELIIPNNGGLMICLLSVCLSVFLSLWVYFSRIVFKVADGFLQNFLCQ